MAWKDSQISSDKIRKYFDYDAQYFADKRWFSSQVAQYDYELTREFLFKSLNLQPSDEVLEVGCGPGVWTEPISRKTKAITAIDISDNMLEKARSRIKTENVIFHRCDFIEYEDSHVYDKILSVRVIEYILNKAQIVDKMYKLIKQGGKVVIITKSTPTLFTIRSRLWRYFKVMLMRCNETLKQVPKISMQKINPWELRQLFIRCGYKRAEIFPVMLRLPLFIHDHYRLPLVNKHYQRIYERMLLKFCNIVARKSQTIPRLLRYILLFFSESYLLQAEK